MENYGEDENRLTGDCDLPWGWTLTNAPFTEKVTYDCMHLESECERSKSLAPQERLEPLRRLVSYLEGVRSICLHKDMCFLFWFYEVFAGRERLMKAESELFQLETDIDTQRKL